MTPPVAKKVPYNHRMHGQERSDPYHWMRDDERKKPDIIAHLTAENEYAEHLLRPTKALQEKLFNELKNRLKANDMSVPVRRRNFEYYVRYESGKEHPIYCRRPVQAPSNEEVILDVNTLAEGHEYYTVGSYAIGEDEQHIAFAEDTVSRRIYTIRLMDLKTRTFQPDRIEGASTSLAWSADGQSFFYVDKDDKTLRPYAVKRHIIGTPQSADQTVYEESDESYYVSVRRSKSRQFIFIELESTTTSEVLYIDASHPASAFRPIWQRQPGVEYDVEHKGNTFFIRTNRDAQNFKLVSQPINAAGFDKPFETILPGRDDAMLDAVEVFEDFLVYGERIQGQRQLRVVPNNGGDPYVIDFGESVYTAFSGQNPEFNTKNIRVVYSSMKTPKTVIDFNMSTREKIVQKMDEVQGGFDAKNYTTKRLWATGRDGTKIPISLMSRGEPKTDGSTPLYLYGYGSYGYAMDPWFMPSWISLVDRGITVAIAHIRGGEEMGRSWYDNGRMFRKMNSFTDFIDCAQFLVNEGYAHPKQLVAAGGSAGGLLMGAVINMEGGLFNSVHAAVPFVDVVTTMLDASIPLTTNEYDEWGNPNKQADYEYMLSYSPYDQVRAQAYPNLIVTTGLHDSQVQYWEPMKWVAKLRDMKTDENSLVFITEMDAGHGGAAGRYKRYETTAKVFAFLMLSIDKNLARWSQPVP